MISKERLDQIAAGIDFHCRKLHEFIETLKDVKASIDQLRQSQEKSYLFELQKLKNEQHAIAYELQRRGLPEAGRYELEFQSLKELLEEWPLAVPPEAICTTEEIIFQRADNILDTIVCEQVNGKRFLDFGCGQGHVVEQARSRKALVSTGYDIKLDFRAGIDLCTDSLNVIKQSAPYDIILLHDVLDHVVDSSPIESLRIVKQLLASGGRVYVRNHPWSSRHGSHLYTKLNKAFIHLVFDEVELTRLGGFSSEANNHVVTPEIVYRQWFKESGFNIVQEVCSRTAVEDFFFDNCCVKDRIQQYWGGDEMAMRFNMEIDTIDYVLETTPSNPQII